MLKELILSLYRTIHMRLFPTLLFALLSLICSQGWADKANQHIQLMVTVDWEGWSLESANIEAMQDFRKKYPHIPMMQLLNPVYFLRKDVNQINIAQQIKSTLLPGDTLGLHIHPWKSLVEFCGITYQATPSYASADEACTEDDCGYTVSLEFAYSQAELTKLVACSTDLQVQQGFARPVHFRAGGWQLGNKLKAALQINGYVFDSSRIDANLLTTRWHADSEIVQMLHKLHPESSPLDQPYMLQAPLMEYPNNAALADYTTTKQILTLFNTLLEHNKSVMVLGFHQETAADYLHRLDVAIPKMEAIAKEKGVTIEWVSQP